MAESVLEKNAVCVECGSEVREGTQFCYACGKPVATESSDEAVIEAEETVAATENNDSMTERSEKLASAAARRKKSRSGQRKPKRVVWEEPGESANRLFMLLCLLIFVIAVGVVFLTVFIK